MKKISKFYKTLCTALITSLGLSVSNLNILAKNTNPGQNYNKIAPVLIKADIAIQKIIPETLDAIGHVEAFKSVDLSFSGTAGKINKINVSDGQKVEKGDIIATLDNKIQIYNLDSANASYKYSKSNYESNKKLSGNIGVVSENKLIQLESIMLQDQAQVELDQVNLDNMNLTAPFSGFFGVFKFHEGSYVKPGDSIIVTLQQINPVKINYSFPSSDLTKIQLAQSVNLTSSVLPGQKFSGSVTYRSQTIDTDTGTIALEAKVNNKDFLLLPGMFVNISQIINPNRILLIIPSIALQTDIDGTYVYVIKNKHIKNGKIYGEAEKKRVTSEVIGDDNLSITSGLKEGDIIISAGQQKIHEGSTVIVDNTKNIQTELFKLHHKKTKNKK